MYIKTVALVLIFLFLGCNKKLNIMESQDCYLDKENFVVRSHLSSDTIFHIFNCGFGLVLQYLDFGTTYCIKIHDMDINEYNDYPITNLYYPRVDLLNIGCRDTTLAKKLIKDELSKNINYDYYFTDSFCIAKHYEVKLKESKMLEYSDYLYETFSGFATGDIDSYGIYHGVEYKDIADKIVPVASNRCCLNTGVMMDAIPGRYEIKIYFEIREILGEEIYLKMIRDSLGFEIKCVKEEVFPFKVFHYKEK